jgi:hypothetical protein
MTPFGSDIDHELPQENKRKNRAVAGLRQGSANDPINQSDLIPRLHFSVRKMNN